MARWKYKTSIIDLDRLIPPKPFPAMLQEPASLTVFPEAKIISREFSTKKVKVNGN